MKTLYLLRHAKSSWKDPTLADFDRPLNRRGKQNAPMMGQRLADRHECPEVMISSPAKRARKTGQLVAQELNYAVDAILFDPRIYEADPEMLLEVVRSLNDAWQEVMLIGHNPGFTELTNLLADYPLDNMVTCGLVKLELPISRWQETRPFSGTLLYYDYPNKDKA